LAEAIAQRQKLAREIYFRLLYVCGLLDENPAPITAPAPSWLSNLYPTQPPQWPPTGVRARVANPLNPTDLELQPLRYLAQLAVNIVDFLDPDDYSTPFMFYTDMDGYPLDDPTKPAGSAPTPNLRYWVFGTELPRIVVNEVLFEYQEPSTNTTFDMFCWVELFNPSGKAETLGPDSGASAKVTDPRYKVVIARADPSFWNPPAIDPIAGAINGDNVLGEFKPDDKRKETTDADFVQGGSPWQLPMPNNNSPYLVLGPGDTIDNTLLSDPMNTPPNWVQTDSLKFTLKWNAGTWQFTTPSGDVTETKEYLVLLRRLAYTEMNKLDVPQTISVYNHPILGAIPDYHPDFNPLILNPYLTQDMMHVEIGKGLCNRAIAGSQSKSWARRNPYVDASDALEANQVTVSGAMTDTWHTLGKQNSGFVSAPPAHPNQATGNTMELLKVSAYKTHLLTRRYQNSSYSEYHYAPWFDPTARIYRALEFLELTPNNLSTMFVSPHRVVGRVNLNTANEQEILGALSEWPSPSGQNFVQKWSDWLDRREPSGTQSPRPVFGFSPGNIAGSSPPLPNGLNHEDSWWRPPPSAVPGTPPILLNDSPSPPLQESADFFAKIYDRITTRSNVFAVWCTVGFFEVDQNGKLGPEIDADVGRQVRYRFFAIVDRTIIAEWMLQNNKPVETQLGRTDIDPRRTGPNGEPPCVIYWSRIQ
jgi:hypothetical protein